MTRPADPELMTRMSCKYYVTTAESLDISKPNVHIQSSKKHQDEHNYKKNSGRYHHPKSNPNDADEESKSDSSEDEKGLLCLFSQEDSDEEMCLMAEEEEVTSQDQYSNYSSESICHENPREAFEKVLKSFYGIEDSHLKLKEDNAKLLAERQDLEDLSVSCKDNAAAPAMTVGNNKLRTSFLGELRATSEDDEAVSSVRQ
nr:lisH domain-containing protein C1711.05-like [Ipomoea batatas]